MGCHRRCPWLAAVFISYAALLSAAHSPAHHRHRYHHSLGPSPEQHMFNITAQFQPLSYREGYSMVFGGTDHLKVLDDGYTVQLTLDEKEGSGFVSQDDYYYGFFSASIKLPSQYSAGVVVAFYTSNLDVYPGSHDELDFEFLGHSSGKEWVLQTNVYMNGSVNTGREERFHLWFDPSADSHEYSILWNQKHIVFFVDNIPIRELMKSEILGAHYLSKPMTLYSTIWDGSGWATDGGKFPVDYSYEPFVSTYSQLELEGCVWNPEQTIPLCTSRLHALDPIEGSTFLSLTPEQKHGLDWARRSYMFYSYCHDDARYPIPLPECVQSEERQAQANRGGELPTPELTHFFKFSSLPASMRVPRSGSPRPVPFSR